MFVNAMTCFVSSAFLTVMLKILHLFHLINWHPTKFTQEMGLKDAHWLAKWGVLFIVIFVLSNILYYAGQFVIMPTVIAVCAGAVIAIMTDWRINHYPMKQATMEDLSIPFIVICIVHMIWIFETAHFHFSAMTFRNAK